MNIPEGCLGEDLLTDSSRTSSLERLTTDEFASAVDTKCGNWKQRTKYVAADYQLET